MAGSDWLSVKDAAKRLSVHPDTVRRWIGEGRLSALRIGPKTTRVPVTEVRRVLREAAEPKAESVA